MIVDKNDNEIKNPDLSKGYIVTDIRIKKDAIPLSDDKVAWDDDDYKPAWDDDDYESVDVYKEYTEEELYDMAESDKKEQFISSAPEDMKSLKANNDMLILVMADIVGG